MKKSVHLCTVALAVAVTLSACSSSGGGSSKTTGAGESSGTAGAKGTPIRVLATGQYTGAGFGYPEMADAAKAAVKAVNAAGGISGHPISLTTCDDKGDPNVAASCARQAVTDKDAAVLGSIGVFGGTITPLLEAAKIAYIGALPVVAQDTNSPIAYPVDGGSPVNFSLESVGLIKAGCTKIGIIASKTGAEGPSIAYATKAAQALGATITKTVEAPSGAPDFTAYVTTLLQSNPGCVALILSTTDMVKAVTAFRNSSNPKIPLSATLSTLPPVVVEGMKGGGDGMLAAASSYNPSATATPTFVAQLKAENTSAPVDRPAELGWSAAQAFIEIAKAINGDVTSASVLAQLAKTTALKLETYAAPINFSKISSIPRNPHLFNFSGLVYVVKGTDYQLAFPDPIDLSSALSAK